MFQNGYMILAVTSLHFSSEKYSGNVLTKHLYKLNISLVLECKTHFYLKKLVLYTDWVLY